MKNCMNKWICKLCKITLNMKDEIKVLIIDTGSRYRHVAINENRKMKLIIKRIDKIGKNN